MRRERESRDFDKMSEKVQEMNVSVFDGSSKTQMDVKTFMKDNKNAFFEVEFRRSAVSGKSHSNLSYIDKTHCLSVCLSCLC